MHRRPPSSMVVALVALFVALGGAGYAAVRSIPGPDGKIHSCYQKTNGNLRVVPAGKRCLKRERALAFNQRGPEGKPGAQGSQGTQGPQGLQGATGAAGSARAYARVFAASPPALETARTKGFTGVRRPSTGIYCLAVDPATGIDPTTVSPVADVEWGNTSTADNLGFAEVRTFNGDCNSNEIDVHTLNSAAAASNLVAFTILVP